MAAAPTATRKRPLPVRLAHWAVRTGLRLMGAQERRTWRMQAGIPDMADSLVALRSRGFEPARAVDVGACVGRWTYMFAGVFPDARVLMVEPQAGHIPVLADVAAHLAPNVVHAHALLGAAAAAQVPFVVLDDGLGGTGSSVFPENSNVPRHTIGMPMQTLADLVEETGFGQPDFLKLDVQGYELEVLKGARSLLRGVQFILLEVSTWPYNVGAPLLHEVVAWLSDAGFAAYDLCGVSRRPDATLLQLDLLFVNRSSPLLKETRTLFARWQPDAGI